MKLAELDPRWYTFGENLGKVGLSFECPHCRTQRLAVAFHHRGHEQFEDGVIRAVHPDEKIWTLDGEDFNSLSLSPSIDASASGHWHGFITNGEIT